MNNSIESLLKKKEQLYFVGINLLVAFFGFFRSYYFMKELDFKELGFIVIIQSISLVIVNLHFGYLNGAFRLQSIVNKKERLDISSNFYSFIIIILCFCLCACLVFFYLNGNKTLDLYVITFALGGALLLDGWLRNYLLAISQMKKINISGLISAIASIVLLLSINELTVFYAALSLFIQPFLFTLVILTTTAEVRCWSFNLSWSTLTKVVRNGYGSYVVALLLLAYSQIERWSISFILGDEELGKMALCFMLMSIWQIVPNSIVSIYAPRLFNSVNEHNISKLNEIIKSFIFITIGYSIVSLLIIYFCLEPVLEAFLPKFYDYHDLVYLTALGLMAKTVASPFSSVLVAAARNKSLIKCQLFSLLIYIIIILAGYKFIHIDLIYFIYSYIIVNLVVLVAYFCCFKLYLNSLYHKGKNDCEIF
ncbi:hypothetical protein MCT05_06600 [Vibrio aestuarianus]|nr:hypothetical protein [Vibrio aestuarianus]